MDTERMKRVLERVYGPAAPTEEKKPPDALRESIRLEAEAAARLRYLCARAAHVRMLSAKRCAAVRRGGGRCTPSFSSAKGSGRRSFAPALRRVFYQRCGRSCFWLARGCGSMRARRKTPCRSRRRRRAALPRSAAPRRAPRRVCSRSR